MRLFRLFLPFLVAIILNFTIAYGQWTQTNGPNGCQVNCLTVCGTNLFAGTYGGGGIFLSTNNGTSWTPVNTGLSSASLPYALGNTSVYSFAVSGTSVFAGTNGGDGVHCSTNNGANWIGTNTGLSNTVVMALAVSPNGAGGTNLFAGTYLGGVFLSTDNGNSWKAVNNGLTNTVVASLAVNDNGTGGSDLFAGTLGGGVFLSTDYGSHWSAVNVGVTSNNVNCLAASGTKIYAGTDSGVFLSTNNGTLWSHASNGLYTCSVRSLVPSGSALIAGTKTGFFVSTDGGGNWSMCNSGLTSTTVWSVAAMPNGAGGTYFFAGTSNGVFRSTNAGATWTETNTGMIYDACTFAVSGKSLFVGTYGSGVFVSGDNGSNWLPARGQLGDSRVRSLAVTPGMVAYAGTMSGLYKSYDYGTTWSWASNGMATHDVYAFAISNADLFAGTSRGAVYRSTDDGVSWSGIKMNPMANSYVSSFAFSPAGGGSATNLFVGVRGDSAGVFLSTNNGSSWTAVTRGLADLQVYALAAIPASGRTNLFAGTYGGGVFLSTDNGSNWSAVNGGLTDLNVNCLAFSDKNLFAGTNSGVFLSTNNGMNWSAVGSGLASDPVLSLTVSGTNLFAGLAHGKVYRRSLGEMVTSVNRFSGDVPARFALEQNYPNPFNPSTEIVYSQPSSSFVTLKVFDALGREIATLVNDFRPQGTYTVPFNASGLSSGLYVYRLQAGNFVSSKKMVVMK